MGRERRRFERIESLVNVRYASKAGEVNGNSLTRDVSETGIGLPVSGKIPVGTAMDIIIFLNKGGRTTEIPAAAKVAWSKRNAEHWKPSYSAGLEFLNMAPADRERLVQYVKNHKWIKSDFERALEENRVPVLNGRGGISDMTRLPVIGLFIVDSVRRVIRRSKSTLYSRSCEGGWIKKRRFIRDEGYYCGIDR